MIGLIDIAILLLVLVWFFAGLCYITDLVLDNIGKVKRRLPTTFWPKRQKAVVKQ